MLDILVILDRSGSMQDGRADHEGGLKSFVNDQKEVPGDVRFTMTQFDSSEPCKVVYDRVRMDQVDRIELVPRGGTPLYDGIGMALTHLHGRQKKNPSDQCIVMVITDGEDTGNTEWTKAMVVARKKELEAEGWTFLFLGANIDAFGEAGSMGIGQAQSANFSNAMAGSVGAMYGTLSNKIGATRVLRSRGVSAQAASGTLAFNSADYMAMGGGTFVKTGLAAIEAEITATGAGSVAPGGGSGGGATNLNVLDDGHSVTVTTTGQETK